MGPKRPLRFAVFGLTSLLGALLLFDCDDSGDGDTASGSFDAASADEPIGTSGDTGTGTQSDASSDGGADSAGDSGCPVSTGPTSPLADAGFPTTGLSLWLRADHGVATLDGGAVCRWDDQSGNNYAFTPKTSTPPTLDPVGLRSYPAVSFVGDSELSRPDVLGLDATSARTVAVYGMATDLTHRFQYFFQGQSGSAGLYFGLDQNTYQTAGSLEGVYTPINSFDSNIPTASVARAQIFSISSLAAGTPLPGAIVYDVDGTLATLTLTSGPGQVESFSAANYTSLGSTVGISGGPFGGAVLGELMVWNRVLTDTERASVESHFLAHFPIP